MNTLWVWTPYIYKLQLAKTLTSQYPRTGLGNSGSNRLHYRSSSPYSHLENNNFLQMICWTHQDLLWEQSRYLWYSTTLWFSCLLRSCTPDTGWGIPVTSVTYCNNNNDLYSLTNFTSLLHAPLNPEVLAYFSGTASFFLLFFPWDPLWWGSGRTILDAQIQWLVSFLVQYLWAQNNMWMIDDRTFNPTCFVPASDGSMDKTSPLVSSQSHKSHCPTSSTKEVLQPG